MIRNVQKYIETKKLLSPERPVIVGLSGGSDSVSLLFILHKIGYQCIAAHCNFHLRGDESDRDEAFCEKIANELNIKFLKTDFDTFGYAGSKRISIEMAARELRYEWFENIRQKYDAQAIAVAHHRDDSVETMLLNLIRGTGIRGLSGMKPRNGHVVRPLLCVSHVEILHFIEEQQLAFVSDSTNESVDYKRNFVRHRLLPLMQELNPAVSEALARTSKHLSEAEIIYLDAIEEMKADLIESINESDIQIDIKKLQQQPAYSSVLYEMLQPYGFSREVTDKILEALDGVSGKEFFAVDSDYKALKDREKLIVYKDVQFDFTDYQLSENEQDWKNLPVNLTFQKVSVEKHFEVAKDRCIATFDYDKLVFPLVLRRWQPGDSFIPFGMTGKKKLSDYFTDHKLSVKDKANVWILCSGTEIIWIVGRRIDNRFRVGITTKNAFIVNFFEK
ncbi:MAG: tRNA lysidine(34) synthetase TilS [Tannerella sp.]|nr:tRNA lysidine(34) synthetase TilS [Tannerella sp.]